MKLKALATALLITLIAAKIFAQSEETTNPHFNWFNLDPEKDNTQGVGTEKAYSELLKGKKSHPVIVAVIDNGVDIEHEDLKNSIWTNTKEIPNNELDDDNNGYIDDVHGWNFLGGKNGKSIEDEQLELTRMYAAAKKIFGSKELKDIDKKDIVAFNQYKLMESQYNKKVEKAKTELEGIGNFAANYFYADSVMRQLLKKDEFTKEDVENYKPNGNQQLEGVKRFMLYAIDNNVNAEMLKEYIKHYADQMNYNYNMDFNAREIVGDDPNNWSDSIYGNNDVIGPNPDHGTFVAGVIAANRTNNLGMKGIADNVQIMSVRVVPNGDERDKDVARGIIYAVQNGAKIINMSFGKSWSANREFVEKALRYAASRNVLLVHAAGNDAENNDVVAHFPVNSTLKNKKIIKAWVEVGACDRTADTSFVAVFSNYGKKSVDFFAPGVNIYSTSPESKYGTKDGTSFSCPATSGVAAVLMSYYPKLTAVQVRDILVKSVVKLPKLIVNLPFERDGSNATRKKVKFSELSVTGGEVNLYKAIQLAEKMK